MVHVKFYGLIRSEMGKSDFKTTEKTVDDVFTELLLTYPHLERSLFTNAVVFVNHIPYSTSKSRKIFLKDGDELVIMSAVCGG